MERKKKKSGRKWLEVEEGEESCGGYEEKWWVWKEHAK